MTTVPAQTLPKSCFISAPAGANLRVLRRVLESRGVRVLVPHDLTVGANWASEVQKQISQADLVVGVLTSERQSSGVLFELGQAWALDRRIVLITPPRGDVIPFTLSSLLNLRIDLDNQEAIAFALDQLLSAPASPRAGRAGPARQPTGLGPTADELLAALDSALPDDWKSLERIVAQALRSSGADVVVQSNQDDVGADLAVWSDVLEPFVGNPLLVEIKARISSRSHLTKVLDRFAFFLSGSGSKWGLLLYRDGPDTKSQIAIRYPNILVLPIRSLLEALRSRAFPEVVRDLRNRRVHGTTS